MWVANYPNGSFFQNLCHAGGISFPNIRGLRDLCAMLSFFIGRARAHNDNEDDLTALHFIWEPVSCEPKTVTPPPIP
jgi:hypothetical protein